MKPRGAWKKKDRIEAEKKIRARGARKQKKGR